MDAEHLLAILLITASSSGTNLVFRYPPHPITAPRLDTPAYNKVSRKGREDHVVHSLNSLGGNIGGGGGGGGNNAGTTTTSRSRARGARPSIHSDIAVETGISQASEWVNGDQIRRMSEQYRSIGDNESTDSSSEDNGSDDDDVGGAGGGGSQRTDISLRGSDGLGIAGMGKGKGKVIVGSPLLTGKLGLEAALEQDPLGRPRPLRQPRSTGDSSTPTTSSSKPIPNPSSYSNSNSTTNPTSQQTPFRQTDYQYCLGYPIQFLNALLSPKKDLCHRKFELMVDSLVFVGHPVCADKDGKWVLPEIEEEFIEERGRTVQPRKVEDVVGGGTPSSLSSSTLFGGGNNSISGNGYSNNNNNNNNNGQQESSPAADSAQVHAKWGFGDHTAPLTSFHLVLVIDKPDPVNSTSSMNVLYDTLYREVAFKWTAAAFAEQARTGWVGEQCRLLGQVRDTAVTKEISLRAAQTEAFAISGLAHSIRTLYQGIRLRSAAHVYIGDIPLDIQLPPPQPTETEEWTKWGDSVSDDSDASSSSNSDLAENNNSDTESLEFDDDIKGQSGWKPPNMHPWKTLLLFEHVRSQEEIFPGNVESRRVSADAMMGHSEFGLVLDSEREKIRKQVPRATREFSEPVKAFLAAVTPEVSLAEISERLGLSLDDEVYPLARYLIYTRHAKLIDVIGPKLRNVFLPDTTSNKNIPTLVDEWSDKFPDLPYLPTFMARMSASPTPYRKLMPDEVTPTLREEYENALYWLLERDLVIQMHTYVRVVANGRVKDRAREVFLEEQREIMDKKRAEKNQNSVIGSRKNSNGSGHASPRASLRPSPRPSFSRSPSSNRATLTDIDDDSIIYPAQMHEVLRDDAEDSIILEPGKASQKTEGRWLEVMLEGHDPTTVDHFRSCIKFFNGRSTLDEMIYETGLEKREIRHLLNIFKEHLITFQHP